MTDCDIMTVTVSAVRTLRSQGEVLHARDQRRRTQKQLRSAKREAVAPLSAGKRQQQGMIQRAEAAVAGAALLTPAVSFMVGITKQ